MAKQAIYCLHRGDNEGAAKKLEKAKEAADKLKPIVEAESSLRACGSYSSSLEEVSALLCLSAQLVPCFA